MAESNARRQLRLRLERECAEIGREIGARMRPGSGFALVCFDFGPGGSMAYVSNAHRADVIKTLRELARKLEGDA